MAQPRVGDAEQLVGVDDHHRWLAGLDRQQAVIKRWDQTLRFDCGGEPSAKAALGGIDRPTVNGEHRGARSPALVAEPREQSRLADAGHAVDEADPWTMVVEHATQN